MDHKPSNHAPRGRDATVRAAAWLDRRARTLSGMILAVVVLTAVGYALTLDDSLRFPDEHEYMAIAGNLAAGNGYSLDGTTPTAYRPPGFTLMATAAYLTPRPIHATRLLNMLGYAAALLLCWRLAVRSGGPVAGVAALTAGAAYPVLLYTAGTLYPQTLAAVLLLLTVSLYFSQPQLPLPRAALCGLAAGLLILTVPSFLFFLAVLTGWTLVEGRDRRAAAGRAAAMLLAAGLVLLPWQVRNLRTFGRVFFVSTNSGINLLLGNNPQATAGSGVNVEWSTWRDAAQARQLDEVARDRFYRQAALQYIRDNPREAGGLYIRKVLHHFHFRNRLHVAGQQTFRRELAMGITYGTLLMLVLLRLAMARREPLARVERFVLLFTVLNGLFAALFFTRIRLRVPVDWLLLVVGGTGIAHTLRAVTARSGAGRAAAGPQSADSRSGSAAITGGAP